MRCSWRCRYRIAERKNDRPDARSSACGDIHGTLCPARENCRGLSLPRIRHVELHHRNRAGYQWRLAHPLTPNQGLPQAMKGGEGTTRLATSEVVQGSRLQLSGASNASRGFVQYHGESAQGDRRCTDRTGAVLTAFSPYWPPPHADGGSFLSC